MPVDAPFINLPVLETPRLRLRTLKLEDVAEFFTFASDPEVTRYLTWDTHTSVEDSRAFLERCLRRYAENLPSPWGIVLKREQKLVGTCGFCGLRNRHASGEIAYALDRPCWGSGYMPEAVRCVLEYGFEELGLNRIEASCVAANAGSARVMEKCGMTFEGILREAMWIKGDYRDLRLYSILRSEFTSSRVGRLG